jgi:hypothetical protein
MGQFIRINPRKTQFVAAVISDADAEASLAPKRNYRTDFIGGNYVRQAPAVWRNSKLLLTWYWARERHKSRGSYMA